ncbi:hypothetical protein, partial [Acidiphilium rubrum]|uniref:hypothetical protein n=1 Tax=Acidiphilium rubrum TaxID=526 RepID=UPI002CF556F8
GAACDVRGREALLFCKKETKNFCLFGARIFHWHGPKSRKFFVSFLQKRNTSFPFPFPFPFPFALAPTGHL